MAVTRITPHINSKGLFTLKAPYGTEGGKLYSVEAIRSFDDLLKLKVNVFDTYYAPIGLIKRTTSNATGTNIVDFDAEIEADVHIVTLRSSSGDYIYVPDSYILSYPTDDNIPYKHIVLAVSLGALPDNYDTTAIATEVKELIEYRFGITDPEVHTVSVQKDLVVTPAEHETLTSAREGATNVIPSSFDQNLILQQQLNEAVAINQTLMLILKHNNLI